MYLFLQYLFAHLLFFSFCVLPVVQSLGEDNGPDQELGSSSRQPQEQDIRLGQRDWTERKQKNPGKVRIKNELRKFIAFVAVLQCLGAGLLLACLSLRKLVHDNNNNFIIIIHIKLHVFNVLATSLIFYLHISTSSLIKALCNT